MQENRPFCAAHGQLVSRFPTGKFPSRWQTNWAVSAILAGWISWPAIFARHAPTDRRFST